MSKELTQQDILQKIAETLAEVQANAGQQQAGVLVSLEKTLGEIGNRMRPENPEHNRISHYNPKGLRDHERPQLKCDIWWVGYPETPETLHDAEIEALNTLEPGDYMVTKGNGNKIPFTVTAKRRMDGTYERLEVSFPCKGENSSDHRSKLDYVREAMGATVPTLDQLMAEVTRLKAQNDTLNAVVAGA